MKHFVIQTIVLLVLVCNASSCCKNEYESEGSRLVEQVWAIAQANPNGFTVNITDMSAPSQGISVAYAATQNSFGKESLPKVISHALSHANYVGGWQNNENNLYYFDSDTIFSESDLEAAKAFGKQQKQISIYIISKDSTVYLQ